MLLNEILLEKAKQKVKKIIYPEGLSDQQPFPDDTMTALSKAINKEAKDLEKDWKSPMELVDFVFEDLSVPKPGSYLKSRWAQYLDLLKTAVDELRDSRGFNDWSTL